MQKCLRMCMLNISNLLPRLWCMQKAMAQLFDVGIPAVGKRLSRIFDEGESIKYVVVSKRVRESVPRTRLSFLLQYLPFLIRRLQPLNY